MKWTIRVSSGGGAAEPTPKWVDFECDTRAPERALMLFNLKRAEIGSMHLGVEAKPWQPWCEKCQTSTGHWWWVANEPTHDCR